MDRILSFIPKNSGGPSPETTLYLAAITTDGTVDGTTALTATTVPNRLTVWATDYITGNAGATRGGGGEPTIGTGSYARKAVANTEWATGPVTNGNGRRVTTNQESFAQSTAAWSSPTVVGFAMVTSASAGAGIAYFYANFDDATSVSVNASGIVLACTAYWQADI